LPLTHRSLPCVCCQVMCMENSVDDDVDLLFVEYLLNDGFKDSIRHNPR
jgi:hypothetical protein